MVELQRYSGMRPGEVVELRPCDITRRIDGVWIYRPRRYKTEHHELDRVVFLGPKAQDILSPWLDRGPDEPCFSPREAVEWLMQKKRQQRKSKVPPSQRDRRRPGAQRPAAKYTEEIYRKSIQYACRKAKVPLWAPNQIRHSVGTIVRERFGLEAAQVTLGHAIDDRDAPMRRGKEYARLRIRMRADTDFFRTRACSGLHAAAERIAERLFRRSFTPVCETGGARRAEGRWSAGDQIGGRETAQTPPGAPIRSPLRSNMPDCGFMPVRTVSRARHDERAAAVSSPPPLIEFRRR